MNYLYEIGIIFVSFGITLITSGIYILKYKVSDFNY